MLFIPIGTEGFPVLHINVHIVQCCGSGSEIRCFLTPGSGSGMEKNPDQGSVIRDEHTGSYFENLVSVFWVKNTLIL
jgi:hypothetical protein